VTVYCVCSEFLDSLSNIITNFPNYDNYVMSASALLRLQDTYDLETTSIAGGLVGSANASPPSMSGTCNTYYYSVEFCCAQIPALRDIIIMLYKFTK